ncbi:hypothetical protein [Clostridium sp.]|uniref:putative ABC transporter permease n=1 Tax=Clostridium sp. TaxID=1506 RepID=UPI0026225ACC|nr:hypothetical protein [Clostridium sp.]
MNIKNKIIHFLVFGMMYINVEVFDRALHGDMINFKGISKYSIMGYSTLWMFIVGGVCGILIGGLNNYPKYYKLKLWQQVLIGGTIITLIEFFTGCFFNLYLKLHLWDYSIDHKYQFMGQICLVNCIFWYLIIIVIIWLDDALSCYFYEAKKPDSLWSYIIKLITLQ